MLSHKLARGHREATILAAGEPERAKMAAKPPIFASCSEINPTKIQKKFISERACCVLC